MKSLKQPEFHLFKGKKGSWSPLVVAKYVAGFALVTNPSKKGATRLQRLI